MNDSTQVGCLGCLVSLVLSSLSLAFTVFVLVLALRLLGVNV